MNDAPPELVFVPLGGAEEIGMNLNLFGYGPPGDYDWLMVDLGVTFADDSMPGVDVIVPDPTFIQQNKDRLIGLVLTHGHEDHIGAVPYLWPGLRCPIYTTPFTAALLRRKLEMDLPGETVKITNVPLSTKFDVGPFSLELISLTHSMPEANAIAVRTPLGTVLHTGDWKFDPGPVVGPVSDEQALRAVGDEGVLATVGDSTNVFVEGTSGSEADLLESLTEIISGCDGRVAVCCFASNVARLQTVFDAATANGRAVALVGRSLWRINAAARETGYLSDLPPFLEADEAVHLPRDEVLYICTGSQGEPRAAMSRIAADDHRDLFLEKGDAVIFSSRRIPGNEIAIGHLQNRLARKGVRVVTEETDFVHVSGHPARDELIRMYQHLRPQIAVPVHGEARHLIEHAALARECQVPQAVVVENGSMVRLAPGNAEIIDRVPAGRLAADLRGLSPIDGQAMRQRGRTAQNGSVVVTLLVDNKGVPVGGVQMTVLGVIEDDEIIYVTDEVDEIIEIALEEMSRKRLRDDKAVAEAARIAVRRFFHANYGKRPLTTVHVVRV